MTTALRFFHTDLIPSATLTASSEATAFPVEHLQVGHLTVPWRATGDTAENVKADLGSAMSVTAAVVDGYNLTSGGTYVLKHNSSDDLGSASTAGTFTAANAGTGPLALVFGAISARYWWLVLADGSNPDGYVEVGRWFLGNHYTAPGYLPGKQQDTEDLAVNHTSPSNGAQDAVERVELRHEVLRIRLPSEAALTAFVAFRSSVRTFRSFWVAIDWTNFPAAKTFLAKLVRKPITQRFSHHDGSTAVYYADVEVREVGA